VLPAEIADDHAIELALTQDSNDLLFGKTFLDPASMYKNYKKTNYPAGYKIPIRSHLFQEVTSAGQKTRMRSRAVFLMRRAAR